MALACRGAWALVLLLLGAVTALAVVAVHARLWGLSLGLAATAAVLVALPATWPSRPPFAVGWAGFVGYAGVPRPEGDYLIASTAAGYVLLLAAPALVVAAFLSVALARPVDGDPVPHPPDA